MDPIPEIEELEDIRMNMSPSERHYENHKRNMRAYFHRNIELFREKSRKQSADVRADPAKKLAKQLKRKKYYLEVVKPRILLAKQTAAGPL